MVAAVRAGSPERVVARRFGVSLSTVQWWVQRAGDQAPESVDFSSQRGKGGAAARHVNADTKSRILELRAKLRKDSDLGEYGADAIHAGLEAAVEAGELEFSASRSTINRVLKSGGLQDGRKRVRRKAPRPGWYLMDVADGLAELDSVDFVEGLKIRGGPLVDVLNVISLHGGLVNSWPDPKKSAQRVVASLLEHWKWYGAPSYAQFDNDTCFEGPRQHKDVLSSVMRLCLACGVTPVFAPPREMGFQAAIESYNGLYQSKVWARYDFENLEMLKEKTTSVCGCLSPAPCPTPGRSTSSESHPTGLEA